MTSASKEPWQDNRVNEEQRPGAQPQHQLPIGVFDSGVGGLTVLRELQQRLPHESFLYFGDTAHVPYGNRAPSEILAFSRQILNWLTQSPPQIKMAVMACNTSSALALDQVRTEYAIPILGIILPGARAAAAQGQRIGVMATPATVQSDCYRQAVLENNPDAEVFQVGCPEFVPIIEQNRIGEPETIQIVQRYVQQLLDQHIDTLVYGCTHYPHLAGVIEPLLPPHVTVVNPAEHMAQAADQELNILQLNNSHASQPPQFCVSGCPDQFAERSTQWLGERPRVKQVVLSPIASVPVETLPPVDA